MTVTLRSFAKINLGLRIGARRDDGFHELLTVYQTIGLHDVVRVSVGRGTGIEILCSDPRVPRDETNTCFRMVERGMKALDGKGRITLEIQKKLPVQGGLGGASSNAIASLLGLEHALKKRLSAEKKLEIAAQVGPDLPLFLVGGTVLGAGRGEHVYPVPDLPAMACVVVMPAVGVSTPKAFEEWDRRQGAGVADPEVDSRMPSSNAFHGQKTAELRSRRRRKDDSRSKLTVPGGSDRMNEFSRGLSAWLSEPYSGAPFGRGRAENQLLELVRAGIENDFERVVFPEYPELLEGKRALLSAGAKYASLSGSGSTLYGLFASKEAAIRAAIGLRKQSWAAQATSTLTRRQYWRRVVAR
jgi:4-diphosphocytidyl-2-C-methyl-D-erythritol kinase